MDPIMKAWMFFQWLEDFNDDFKLLENQSYIIGSFVNPEAVKRMLGKDSETFEATDEDFDKFSRQILENNRMEEKETIKHRRKRRKILDGR
jgi:hypothetical protein